MRGPLDEKWGGVGIGDPPDIYETMLHRDCSCV